MTLRFCPEEHIRKRPEFQRIHELGSRINGRLMTAIALPNGRPHSRLGIVASRRVGGAVQRNRAKRLIREAFRLSKGSEAGRTPVGAGAPGGGLDIVIIPRAPLLEASFEAITADFRDILNRHAKRARA